MIRKASHRQAQIAASLEGENMTDFASEALDAKSKPILRKHKVKLPADAEPVSRSE